MDNIVPFRSEKYIVAVGTGHRRFKTLQIIFGKKDGSLFVNFPYFKYAKGLVSVVTFPGGDKYTAQLSLEPGGKVTSHRVKYSHHPDGTALFSQAGQVLSVVRKQSIPLAKAEGHIFTVHLQQPNTFESADEKGHGIYTPKRAVLTFDFGESTPEAVKIVGRWYSLAKLKNRIPSIKDRQVFGPRAICETPERKRYLAFLLSAPQSFPIREFVLILTCEKIGKLDKEGEPILIFMGGFDEPNIINDLSEDTSFLALSYPASNYDDLVQRVGSIDFIRQSDTNYLRERREVIHDEIDIDAS
jgi:hypothetical protein